MQKSKLYSNPENSYVKSIYWVLIFLSVCAQPSFAAFEIYEEDSEGYYGSAQTRPFKDAVDNTDALNSADLAFLDSVEITRVTERWYARLMVGKAKVNVLNFSNNSSPFLDTFQLSTGSVTDNVYQLLIAGGKIWEQWAFEIEALFSKKISYFTEPVLIGTSHVPDVGSYSTNASVQLYIYVLTANVQYIIPRLFSFYPRRLQIHLDAGAGAAILNSSVTGAALQPIPPANLPMPPWQSVSQPSYPAVGMLGVGARYQISPHFLTGVTYRYYAMGKSKYGPVQNIKWQSDQLRSTGFYIDVTYQY
jgi:opacity protein-like surface antigen